ncbi:hypothetical protein JXA88_05155, partial [Candidatus Fermentibacteria bacterium]|nr:hypothetical protein [Candidatus Fermentibacteria bacterium]
MHVDGRVVVVTTEADGLWRQGFGSVETAARICSILADYWRESRLAIVNTEIELQGLIEDPPALVFSGINYLPGGAKTWISQALADAGINYT